MKDLKIIGGGAVIEVASVSIQKAAELTATFLKKSDGMIEVPYGENSRIVIDVRDISAIFEIDTIEP